MDAHKQEVLARYQELEQEDSTALAADEDVRAAARALESARRRLEFDPYNQDLQREISECEHGWHVATNTFHRNQNLARIAARKAEQARVAAAQEAEADARRKQVSVMTPEKAALLLRYRSVL